MGGIKVKWNIWSSSAKRITRLSVWWGEDTCCEINVISFMKTVWAHTLTFFVLFLWKFIVFFIHLSCTYVHTYPEQLQGLRNSHLLSFTPSHLVFFFVSLSWFYLSFRSLLRSPFVPLALKCFTTEMHCIMSVRRDMKWHYPTSLCSVHAKAASAVTWTSS